MRRVRATYNGAVIAESDRTIVVEGNHYFPPEDVRAEYLVDSERTTRCVWKGRASYKTVEVDGERAVDAAWFYPSPTPLARRVKGHYAFWRGVHVQEV